MPVLVPGEAGSYQGVGLAGRPRKLAKLGCGDAASPQNNSILVEDRGTTLGVLF